eukprot:Gregarina_sp_Poly_1__10477@NODE_764_length_6382_cov_139_313381_g559_i1_p1_GENE_NODE_764_length_6382_cov_139_313381_g559_i1NODE_764_length_6382_cov_139_313381_g559_i1_p1_ORF_typecomplete_len1083_score199_51TroponinI_N/PF11636_8/1_8TroponinI_N/PF11636_8/1_1e03_NODE_764_length_6382_cov_139_313381_g559_i121975445
MKRWIAFCGLLAEPFIVASPLPPLARNFVKSYTHCLHSHTRCIAVEFDFRCQDPFALCRVYPIHIFKFPSQESFGNSEEEFPSQHIEESVNGDAVKSYEHIPLADAERYPEEGQEAPIIPALNLLPEILGPIPLIGPILSGVFAIPVGSLARPAAGSEIWARLLTLFSQWNASTTNAFLPRDSPDHADETGNLEMKSKELPKRETGIEESRESSEGRRLSLPPATYIPLAPAEGAAPWLSQVRLPVNVRAATSSLDLLKAMESKAVDAAPHEEIQQTYEQLNSRSESVGPVPWTDAIQEYSTLVLQHFLPSRFNLRNPSDLSMLPQNPMLGFEHDPLKSFELHPLLDSFEFTSHSNIHPDNPKSSLLAQGKSLLSIAPITPDTVPTTSDLLPWIPLDSIASEFPAWLSEALMGPYALLFEDLIRVAQDAFIRLQVIVDAIGDEPIPVNPSNLKTFSEKMAAAFRTSLANNEADAIKSLAVTIQQLPLLTDTIGHDKIIAPEGSSVALAVQEFENILHNFEARRRLQQQQLLRDFAPPRLLEHLLSPEDLKQLAAATDGRIPTTSDLLPWKPLDSIIAQYPKYLHERGTGLFDSFADSIKDTTTRIANMLNPFSDKSPNNRESRPQPAPIRWGSETTGSDLRSNNANAGEIFSDGLNSWPSILGQFLPTDIPGSVDIESAEKLKPPKQRNKLFSTKDTPTTRPDKEHTKQEHVDLDQKQLESFSSESDSVPETISDNASEKSDAKACASEICRFTMEVPCSKLEALKGLIRDRFSRASESMSRYSHIRHSEQTSPVFDLMRLLPPSYMPLVDAWLDDTRKILAKHANEIEIPPFLDPWIEETDPALSLIDLVGQISAARLDMSIMPELSVDDIDIQSASTRLTELVNQVLENAQPPFPPQVPALDSLLNSIMKALLSLPEPPTLQLTPAELQAGLYSKAMEEYAHEVDDYWLRLGHALQLRPMATLDEPVAVSHSVANTQQMPPAMPGQEVPAHQSPLVLKAEPLVSAAGIDASQVNEEAVDAAPIPTMNTLKGVILGGLDELNKIGANEYSQILARKREIESGKAAAPVPAGTPPDQARLFV